MIFQKKRKLYDACGEEGFLALSRGGGEAEGGVEDAPPIFAVGVTYFYLEGLVGAGGKADVLIALSQKHIIFRVGRYDVVSRLLEGDFIDFRSSIPANSNTVVEVKVRDFLNSIDRTSLLINDRLKSPIRLSIGDGEIKISCATAIGKISDVVECDIKGEPVDMGFNNRYLLEALRATGCDKVKMIINSSLSPVKIVPMEGESFLFLVLPVRMKADI